MALTKPESKRIIELLGKGGTGWQDAEPIIQEAMKRVHPGEAARHAEAQRQRAINRGAQGGGERQRHQDRVVEIGARDIVVRRLRTLQVQDYIESRVTRGKRQLRLKVCPTCHRPLIKE